MRKIVLFLSLSIQCAQSQTLKLDEVLESVGRSYPPLLAALAERNLAEADVIAALGKFDLTLRARIDTDQFGYYKNERAFTGFEQPTQWMGAGFYGGWRAGDGSFAPYDGKLDTRSLGEWSGGFKMPLLRDRAIDSKRADLRKAELGRGLAALSIEQQRLVIQQLATRRYWDWVAAANRVQLAQSLLNIAVARDHFLKESANAGQIAAIEVTENARAILQRRTMVVEAERALQQAAIELSLYYRDTKGTPVLASRSQAPSTPGELQTIDDSRLLTAVETAIRRRPDLRRFDVQRAQLEVERRLATNDRRPAVDFQLGFTAEGGQGNVRRGPQELKAGIAFELPFQRRTATGKILAAEAKINQLTQRERFLRDQIAAEVRDAVSAVQAAFDRAQLLDQEIRVARELEEAERARFQLGDGTLFLVNLREQVTADTVNRHISAVNDYYRAWAQYEFSIAAGLLR